MDDLERDLHSTFGRLADGRPPSDALVARTLERAVELRRRRRVAGASALAAAALLVTVGVASLTNAGGPGAQVQVTNPSISELPATTTSAPSTTTSAPAPTTTIATHRVPPGHKTHTLPTPAPTTPSPASAIPTACAGSNPGSLPVVQQFTRLANGDVRVHFAWVWSSAGHRVVHYALDDGTTGELGFTKEYAPDAFGAHWYSVWAVADRGGVGCSTRHDFTVDPTTATPDTTPETTTVPATTTAPETTTIPVTTTTAGP